MIPGRVTFTDEENWRSLRADVAIILGVTPRQVDDDMTEVDVFDVLMKYNANQRIQNKLLKDARR